MVRRKESDQGVGVNCGDPQQAVKNCRRRAAIARLRDQATVARVAENRSVVALMGAVDDVKKALVGEFQRGAHTSFFEQSRAAEHRAKLLRPLVSGDPPSARFEPRAVAAGEDHGPFVLALWALIRRCFSPRWLSHIYPSWRPGPS